MVANYATIKKELTTKLTTRHKFDTFIYYFLRMVVMINLDVARTDVPMVFRSDQ